MISQRHRAIRCQNQDCYHPQITESAVKRLTMRLKGRMCGREESGKLRGPVPPRASPAHRHPGDLVTPGNRGALSSESPQWVRPGSGRGPGCQWRP